MKQLTTIKEIIADDSQHILRESNESALIYEVKRLILKVKLFLNITK